MKIIFFNNIDTPLENSRSSKLRKERGQKGLKSLLDYIFILSPPLFSDAA